MPPLSTLPAHPLLTLAHQIIFELSWPSSPASFLNPPPFTKSDASPSSSTPSSPKSEFLASQPPLESSEDSAIPESVLALLPTRPSAVLALSRSKLHTYPFAAVPRCWSRLFVDSSALVAARKVIRHFKQSGIPDAAATAKENAVPGSRERGGKINVDEDDDSDDESVDQNDKEDWISPVVHVIDMALLMTGGIGRVAMISALLNELEMYLEDALDRDKKGTDAVAMGDLQRPGKRPKLIHHDSQDDGGGASPSSVSDDLLPVWLDGTEPQINFPVRRCGALPFWRFFQHVRPETGAEGGPLVITDSMEHWPARRGKRAWNQVAYLMSKTMGGRRLVPVEVGRSYTDEGWGQKIITFREFVDGLFIKKNTSDIRYLAQHDLFEQIPALRNDISIPDYCFSSPPVPAIKPPGKDVAPMQEPLLNAWFGPAGTVSPLHADPYYNILCQVVGKKYVRLYMPRDTAKLYPRGIDVDGIDMSNTSNVDVEGDERVRDEKFPLFREAPYVETILGEGECLYIPIGWWHYVRSLTVSISVSFWFN